MYRILFILFFLTGCGSNNPGKPFIEDEFRPYLDKFLIEAIDRGVSVNENLVLSIYFDDNISLDNETSGVRINGVCTWRSNGERKVRIERSIWETKDIYEREQLIFHELGHCLLDFREHRNEKQLVQINHNTTNRVPSSIMSEFSFSSSIYNLSYRYYLDELFLVNQDFLAYQGADNTFDLSYYDTHPNYVSTLASFSNNQREDLDSNFIESEYLTEEESGSIGCSH